jgi:serine/threonine-protein kinase
MSTADAEKTLQDNGFTPGQINKVDSPTVIAGVVISTDPAPGGKAHVGDTIDLTVSNGNVTLPDVTGQSIAAATSLLGGSDLGLTPKPQPDATCPTQPGTLVHTQSLPPGEVPQGSTVILTYCTGTS